MTTLGKTLRILLGVVGTVLLLLVGLFIYLRATFEAVSN